MNYLSLCDCITLIKFVLLNLANYIVPMFKCSSASAKHIERFQRDFSWKGRDYRKKIHLLDWNKVCKPKRVGGFEISPLKIMNEALLGKWLWQVGDEFDGLWKQSWLLNMVFFNMRGTHSWLGHINRASREVLSVKDDFNSMIRCQLGFGELICFWLGTLVGLAPLASQFSNRFS